MYFIECHVEGGSKISNRTLKLLSFFFVTCVYILGHSFQITSFMYEKDKKRTLNLNTKLSQWYHFYGWRCQLCLPQVCQDFETLSLKIEF